MVKVKVGVRVRIGIRLGVRTLMQKCKLTTAGP